MRALPRFALVAFASAAMLLADGTCVANAPCYSAAGVVNAASSLPGTLAPNTWASIYGTNLSTETASRSSEDELPGFGGVNVLVNSVPALLSYVSPTQVNFLMPWDHGNEATIQLTRDGTYGPAIVVALAGCSPALFPVYPASDPVTAVAAHTDWTLVTPASPAHAGEYVILYATGLGPYSLAFDNEDNAVPTSADLIAQRTQFTLLLDGQQVDDELIEYVGAAPLFIGDYQINLKLPAWVGPNPEIQIGLGGILSPTGIHLSVAPALEDPPSNAGSKAGATVLHRAAFHLLKGVE